MKKKKLVELSLTVVFDKVYTWGWLQVTETDPFSFACVAPGFP